MDIEAVLLLAVYIAASNVFLLLLAVKFGTLEWIRVNSRVRLITKLAACEFCMCFWLSVACMLSAVTGAYGCASLNEAISIVIVSTVLSKVLFNLATTQYD